MKIISGDLNSLSAFCFVLLLVVVCVVQSQYKFVCEAVLKVFEGK